MKLAALVFFKDRATARHKIVKDYRETESICMVLISDQSTLIELAIHLIDTSIVSVKDIIDAMIC